MAEPAAAVGPLAGGEFRFPVRVYYEDTDAGGIVYHANYLQFAERARTETLRRLGIDQSRLRDEHDVIFIVRRCTIDYRAPARLDDALEVRTRMTGWRGASIEAEQTVHRRGEDGALVALDLTIACVNGRGRPVRIPGPVREAFERAAGDGSAGHGAAGAA
ncbi:thioesterase [Thalassobaculum fulvum]|uniref:Thioesterase n=1 Tax=Thalassobaculum fulvum TaxID=1633335 RepID=A0A919CSB3_9PROT|nr:tol-pal system-associated acyl-CoA thioesterase [Thalassobaculum fulvum]GHD63500.1 thioesterase [Thalassobaculum fulvum]